MTTEPEALRLANRLAAKANAMRNLGEELEKVARDNRRTMRDRQADQLEETAAELRRLYAQSLADEELIRESMEVLALSAANLRVCWHPGTWAIDQTAIRLRAALSRLRQRLGE